ncbi:MAG: hypothetical protein FWH02_05785 [Oscillospiraceae bacterium]|nr:hypothetical protein [Oscillospiraceae bacterium]
MIAAGIFGAAISAAGGQAFLLRDGAQAAFTASIQPVFRDREGRGSSLGTRGFEHFTAYMAYDDITRSIARGDIIRRRDRDYHIRRIETVFYADEPAYRKAALTLCEPEGGSL